MTVLRVLNQAEILQVVLVRKVGNATVKTELERQRQRSISFPEAVPFSAVGGSGCTARPARADRSLRTGGRGGSWRRIRRLGG